MRDTRFPVRITLQLYEATSGGHASDVVPESDARPPTAWQTIPHPWFPR